MDGYQATNKIKSKVSQDNYENAYIIGYTSLLTFLEEEKC